MKEVKEIGSDTTLVYIPDFIDQEKAEETFDYLKNSLSWRQDKYGKYPVPRLTAFMASADVEYKYSGLTHQGKGIDQEMVPLLTAASKEADEEFNSILFNFYRDEKDSIGFHSDDEPELGDNPIVAALSLGDSRVFSLHHIDLEYDAVNLTLASGSLVIMGRNCQKFWRHGIKKNTGGTRISLTFRKIVKLK
jgi:alkylated DNA repair dioxygenase AlkB